MHRLATYPLFVSVLACMPVLGWAAEKPARQIALFNGKNLDGWKHRFPARVRGEMKDTWSVVNGVLVCTGRPVGYLMTEKSYTNYVMKLEWRWPPGVKPGNNGVLLRLQGGEHFHNDVWPRSIEAQLANQNAGDIFTIGEFPFVTDAARLSGRRTAKLKPSNEKPQGEWNEYEIILKGPNLTIKVNGQVQNTASDVLVVPGPIGLQSERAPIEYRNIRLVALDN